MILDLENVDLLWADQCHICYTSPKLVNGDWYLCEKDKISYFCNRCVNQIKERIGTYYTLIPQKDIETLILLKIKRDLKYHIIKMSNQITYYKRRFGYKFLDNNLIEETFNELIIKDIIT